MIPDDAMLMAYADGELDPLAAKRVERALAADPALTRRVDAHRTVRTRVSAAYPVETSITPDPLAALIQSQATVVPMIPSKARRKPQARWVQAAAIAACLVLGVGVGTRWQSAGPIVAKQGALVASGSLAEALDTRLAATEGSTHMLLSFRGKDGRYCRVFASAGVDGIACRKAGAWSLVRTRSDTAVPGGDYRQAGSANADLMAEAQDMTAGDPLSREQEADAIATGWRDKDR